MVGGVSHLWCLHLRCFSGAGTGEVASVFQLIGLVAVLFGSARAKGLRRTQFIVAHGRVVRIQTGLRRLATVLPDAALAASPTHRFGQPDTDDTKRERGDIRPILRACKGTMCK